MEKEIKAYLRKNNIRFAHINHEPIEIIEVIHKLLIKGIVLEKDKIPNNGTIYLYYGIYYEMLGEYDLMKEFYLKSIELNRMSAVMRLGIYYSEKEMNYEEAKKYFTKLIEMKHGVGAYCMGILYEMIYQGNNEESITNESIKYYKLAIEMGYVNAYTNLAKMYEINENYDEAEKNYIAAVENGDERGMCLAAVFYKNIKHNTEMFKHYILMAADKYSKDNDYSRYNKSVKTINKSLAKSFDLPFAIGAHKYLNQRNLNKLNRFICCYEQNKERLVNKTVCSKCGNDSKCVLLKCQHFICTECFTKDNQCKYCSKKN